VHLSRPRVTGVKARVYDLLSGGERNKVFGTNHNTIDLLEKRI
jgi:ABC-type hemin transport system ATPase subunit